ncbi:MAG TPA: S9 family peptidase [Chitinophagales bacterium]|nr:S9 family peptidase [Chitinophagales bacterium]
MKKYIFLLAAIVMMQFVSAQDVMTPELLWSLGRVNAECVSADKSAVIYSVKYYDQAANSGESNLYAVKISDGSVKQLTNTKGTEYNVVILPNGKMGYLLNSQLYQAEWDGSAAKQITNFTAGLDNVKFSDDGTSIIFSGEVKTGKTLADLYPQYPKADVKIIDDLMFRHWDIWEDENSSHVFYAKWNNGNISNVVDIMENEPYDCPTKPWGGAEDFIWGKDGKSIIYVTKKLTGKEYAVSTNTDLYEYEISTAKTKNLTPNFKGYDTRPTLSPDGKWLAFLSMEQAGNEADKNRIMILNTATSEITDLSKMLNETVDALYWSPDSKHIYLQLPTQGTISLYSFDWESYQKGLRKDPISQDIKGQFDITGLVGFTDSEIIVSRTDMNHAAEIFAFNTSTNALKQVTHVNDDIYNNIALSKVEPHWIKTTDDKEMLVWVILPPNFDPTKKYPTLLYCQGGPQSPVSQFYSFRWNFQLMAANGYVIIAPNRRGMQGHGVEWNAAISKDWGGQPIRDYLSAIDWAKKDLDYVDDDRCGAVGASYGGYSIFMLEGVSDGRFKSFIAHDGVFNLQSMYGATEELWFTNWEMDGPYWETGEANDKSYSEFNPIEHVDKWKTPILIFQGGKDFRVTEDQAFQAFTAAQLLGLKSKLVYFPNENHWVLSYQNAMIWHKEFYSWLKETL